MILTVTLLLVLAAFIVTILSALTPARAPLWIAVLLVCVALLLRSLPIG